MRKTVIVYGIGERKQGVSKKKNVAYDFTEVSVGFDDEKFNGYRCETLAIDTSLLAGKQLAVGEPIDIVYHQFNFKTFVDAVL